MKIGLLLEHLDPTRGGLEVWALRYLRWLQAQGDTVHVACRTARTDLLPAGIPIQLLPDTPDRHRVAEAADAWIRSQAFDATHDLGLGCAASLLHLQSGSRFACRLAETHSYPPFQKAAAFLSPRFWFRALALRRFERLQLSSARGRIVVPSQRVVRDLAEHAGLPPHRCQVVPNAADTEQFQPAPRSAPPDRTQPFRLLFLACNPWLKGLPTLLDALRHWPASERPFSLVIAGVRHHTPFLRHPAVRAHPGRYSWPGHVPDPRPLLASTDLLVHPSNRDAGSLVLWEAWASGIPVVGSPDDGSAEHIIDGINGWRLPAPRDPASLLAILRQAANHPDPASLAQAARATALKGSQENQFLALRSLLAASP